MPRSLLQPKAAAPSPGVEATLQERLALYQRAIESARQAGGGAKMRRYDRGLKVSGRAGDGRVLAPYRRPTAPGCQAPRKPISHLLSDA